MAEASCGSGSGGAHRAVHYLALRGGSEELQRADHQRAREPPLLRQRQRLLLLLVRLLLLLPPSSALLVAPRLLSLRLSLRLSPRLSLRLSLLALGRLLALGLLLTKAGEGWGQAEEEAVGGRRERLRLAAGLDVSHARRG